MHIELLKLQNKKYFFEGDEIEYRIIIKNDEQFNINNLEIKYLMFNEMVILKQAVEGNIPVVGNFFNRDSLRIRKIAPSSIIKIKLRVKISKSMKGEGPFDIFKINYMDNNRDLKTTILKENIITLNDNFFIDLYTDESVANVGEFIKMNINLDNKNNFNIDKLNIIAYLDNKIKFIKDTLIVNGKTHKDFVLNDNILEIKGININSQKEILINFDCKILEEGYIDNRFLLEYKFDFEDLKALKTKEQALKFFSYKELDLLVKKIPSDVFVTIEDKLGYKIEITNLKKSTVYNVSLFDFIPDNCELIENSFEINYEKRLNSKFDKKINIGNIESGKTVVITYFLKILTCNYNQSLENILKINYKYINNKNAAEYKTLNYFDNDEHTVKIGISNFKCLNLDSFLKLSFKKPKIKTIEGISANINIQKKHVINTITSKSCENQNLTGFQVIIFGILEITLKYISAEKNNKILFDFFENPFSSSIVLPGNYDNSKKIEIIGSVENINCNLSDEETIFYTSDILINVKLI